MAIFDQAAVTYDQDFTFSLTGSLQRERVYFFLKDVLFPAASILEINCGTGEDALWFARHDYHVIATDLSGTMIEKALEKKADTELKSNPTFQKLGFHELSHAFQPGSFDFVFSNFGGLNCIDHIELKKMSQDFFELLKPGGKLIGVIMGHECLWEKLYFLSKGDFKKMNRRSTKNPLEARVGSSLQKTFYYSPREFQSYFVNTFSAEIIKPVGIALPPSYLEKYFIRKRGGLKWLNRFEKKLAFRYFANYADHYFIVLKKRDLVIE